MRLTAASALAIAVYLLVADGLAALFLGGLLGVLGLVVVGAAVAGSLWQEPLHRRLGGIRWLGPTIVAAAAAGAALEIVVVAPSMLDAFTHLLLFLLLVKLYTRRTPRDARDLAFLAFFMVVAAAPATTSVVFLGLFVVFLVVGTWLLMLRHLISDAGDAAAALPPRRALGLGADLVGVSVAAAAALIVITTVLFLVIPRVGQAALPLRPHVSRMVSGFSERVELGAFGEIEADSTVVMRVHLGEWRGPGRPETLPALRWRGIAFDAFDGRTWRVSRSTLRLTLRRALPVPFPVHQYYGGPVLTQEIYLEPIGTEMLFGAARVLRLHGRSEFLTVDDLGNVAMPVASARLQYTVDSEPEVGDPRALDVADARLPPDPRWLARYTQLPAVAPRIVELARTITAGASDHYDAALRLSGWLSRELRYTRVLERPEVADPLEDFLFVRRAGNCEYFAAALAVMLRTQGIAARVVNGFQRGEWNPYGGYFMVRLRDAHSWVEVFVDGAGWVSLDPSPRGAAEAMPHAGRAMLWLDAVRLSWYRYVVSFSLQDQLAAAEAVRRATWTWGASALRTPDWRWLVPRAAAAGVIVAALAFTLSRRRRPAPAGARAIPRFYARALRALARRGLAPAAGETAREFARRAGTAPPAAPFARLTAVYERVRFGGVALTADEAATVEAALSELERTSR